MLDSLGTTAWKPLPSISRESTSTEAMGATRTAAGYGLQTSRQQLRLARLVLTLSAFQDEFFPKLVTDHQPRGAPQRPLAHSMQTHARIDVSNRQNGGRDCFLRHIKATGECSLGKIEWKHH